MRIGLLPANRNAGGVFQYSLSMIEALDARGEDQPVLVHNRGGELPLAELQRAGWETAALPQLPQPRLAPFRAAVRATGAPRLLRRRPRVTYPDPDDVRFDPVLDAWLADLRLDLMLYPVPTTSAFQVSVPYVASIHDLQHRLQPEFPEVSANGEAETREYLFRNLIRSAVLVLADSEVGREDILDLYGEFGIEPERIRVLPFAPPSGLLDSTPTDAEAVRERYRLPERYLFYPAQFWPHKNHLRLVRALALLHDTHGIDATLVLCGAHDGELRERTHADVARLVRELGLESSVRQLGYVTDEELRGLYAGAAALVMPTFFGPTNIPVLEAWAAGCPVVTSDLRGIREQVGDGAVLVDPRSAESIAEAVALVWSDPACAAAFAERGRERLRAFTPDEYRVRLREILDDARERIRAGERGVRQWRT